MHLLMASVSESFEQIRHLIVLGMTQVFWLSQRLASTVKHEPAARGLTGEILTSWLCLSTRHKSSRNPRNSDILESLFWGIRFFGETRSTANFLTAASCPYGCSLCLGRVSRAIPLYAFGGLRLAVGKGFEVKTAIF